MKKFLAIVLFLALAGAAMANLRSYAPDSVTVNTSSTVLLAADANVQVVQLTNTGTYNVWVCETAQTPVVGKGFWIPAGGSITFSGDNVPRSGLKAIADGGATTVSIGKG